MTDHSGYVALIGRPNTGKSTLLNRLLGSKLAITSPKPQTTRHAILGIKTLPGGQIVYVDTPGMHQRSGHALNRYLNRTADAVLREVDLILFIVEVLRWNREDEAVRRRLDDIDIPVILVINKIDRIADKARLLPFIDQAAQRYPFHEVIPVSARTGDQVPLLEQRILTVLPESEALFPPDQITDRSERFFAAELLREQLTRCYAKELPYSVTVEIESFKDEDGLYRIAAIIWVERAAQKGIIIGKDSAALKSAAAAARKEMEKFFARKVFLQVWVKVKKSWASDESALARLGYTD